MTKVPVQPVQPVATQAPHAPETSYDVMGFLTGTLQDLGGISGYVRNRRCRADRTVAYDALAYEKQILQTLAAEDDAPLPSNSGFAREALRFIAIAEDIISEFPIEHREAARRLSHAVRQATLHESTAILRKRAAGKAIRGEKQIRDAHKANQASRPWHIGDDKLFYELDALIARSGENNGKKLRNRSALKRIMFPDLLGRPDKLWPSDQLRDLDAALRRYSRKKKNLDVHKASK